VVETADRPEPGPGQALVRVHAAAITRDELDWPVERLPAIPSYELSGVVEQVAPDVTVVAPGEEVFALTRFDRDGVAADYAAVDAELLVARPLSVGHGEAAAIPLPALTAWQALFDHGRLQAGERVLIYGARGAVGGFAVQLAAHAGAHVLTAALDPFSPVDLLLDTAGGDRLRHAAALVRKGGRLISIAEPPPDGGEFFIVEPNREQLATIASMVDAGELRPLAVEPFPLDAAKAAFARSLVRGRHAKVVLRP
jgi:NADPH:quinone reductase-like Zn-dependent oxidoreductase